MKNINITIRKATAQDLSTLEKFQQGVVEAERPFDPTLNSGELQYYNIAELIKSPEVEILVAESGNQLIGSGYARIETAKPYLKHQQYAYLGFMFVAPNFRRLGVNGLIINGLQAWCQSKNISELRLDVYAANHQALKAYEKAGFKPHLLEMRLGI